MYAVCSVALLAAAGLVAGCTSEPEPGPSTSKPLVTTPPPSSPTPIPTKSSSSPSATGMPAAAKVKSEAGAIAFVKYYFDQVAIAWTVPNPDALDGLSHEDCITCADYRENAASLQKAKERYRSAPATVVSLKHMNSPSGHMQLEMRLRQNATQQLSLDGQVVKSFSQATGTFIVDLVWTQGGWKLWGIA